MFNIQHQLIMRVIIIIICWFQYILTEYEYKKQDLNSYVGVKYKLLGIIVSQVKTVKNLNGFVILPFSAIIS